MPRILRTVYLNDAAGAWPKAPGVVQAVCDAMQAEPAEQGRGNGHDEDSSTRCRRCLAELLNVEDPSTIALTTNATHALNLALFGLPPSAFKNVVTSVAEHNSVLRPLAHRQRDEGFAITRIGLAEDGNLDMAAVCKAIDDRPSLVVLTHASNVTGCVFPVAEVFAMAKAVGAITVLDAAQSFGRISVKPDELHADAVALAGHKGVRGPAGTGALWTSPELDLKPLLVGGAGVRSDLVFQPSDMPAKLEAGTPNGPAIAGLATAAAWCAKHGTEAHRKEYGLARRLRKALMSIPGVTLYGNVDAEIGIVSFTVKGWDVEEFGFVLDASYGIICRAGLHCAPQIHEAIGSAPHGTVRLSLSGFNTECDVDEALTAIHELATSRRNAA